MGHLLVKGAGVTFSTTLSDNTMIDIVRDVLAQKDGWEDAPHVASLLARELVDKTNGIYHGFSISAGVDEPEFLIRLDQSEIVTLTRLVKNQDVDAHNSVETYEVREYTYEKFLAEDIKYLHYKDAD